MANIRNLNQQNPFWDWVSQLESTGTNHPFSNAYNPQARESHGSPPQDVPPPPHHDSGPPPRPEGPHGPEHHAPPPPPPYGNPFGFGFPFGAPHHGPHHQGGPHAHQRGRGSWGGRRHGGHCGGGERGFPMGGAPFDLSKIGEFISQFIPEEAKDTPSTNSNKDFTPPADIFDTEDAYIVHISLPGAKKEDVGVNWDADKSELNVAGVIYRPGDEEFLKTLALDERKIGVFERKVKLGSKEKPAQVDIDSIGAKMEDGILMVTIPKTDADIVEVKKVDIE